MSFEEVAARAIEYAEKGFPLRPRTVAAIRAMKHSSRHWPDNQRYLAQAGRVDVLAPATPSSSRRSRSTLSRMVEAERATKAQGRARRHRGGARPFLQGRYRRARWSPSSSSMTRRSIAPISPNSLPASSSRRMTTYRGYEVYKHGFGSQGPALLETLNILENFDLHAMKLQQRRYISIPWSKRSSSPMRIATAITAIRLRRNRRRKGLLSKAYAKERAALIDPQACLARLRRRQPAAVRFACQSVELLGRELADAGQPGGPVPDPEPVRQVPTRTPPTSPSSIRTATSSTRRRAAAGSAAP